MKTSLKYKITVLALFSLTFLSAQQNSLFNTYSLDPLQLNIAYAGAACTEANLHYRTQWLGLKDSPKVFQVNAHTALGKSNGLGLRVNSQTYGILNLLGATLGYSYRVKLNETDKLHLGIGLGFSQATLNGSKATVIDANDATLNNNGKQAAAGFDSEFGAMYIGSKLKAGISALHLYNSNPNFSGGSTFKTLPQLNTQVSYIFNKDHNFEVEPWLLSRYTIKGNNVLEAMVNVKYNKIISLGAGYRSGYGMLLLLGAKIGNIRLGYSFDYGAGKNATNLGSSHQVMLGFSMCRAAKPAVVNEETIATDQPTVQPTLLSESDQTKNETVAPPEEKISMEGVLKSSDNKVLKNTVVKVLNDKDEVIDQTTTNKDGAFAFRNIPANQNVILAVNDTYLPEGTPVKLSNLAGKEVKSENKSNGVIKYKILASDKTLMEDMKVDESSLKMALNGILYDQDMKPLALAIKVKEENGATEQSMASDANGKFTFKNLDAEKNYLLDVIENNPSLAGVTKINIADEKGKVFRIIDLSKEKPSFKLLDADKIALGEFTVEEVPDIEPVKTEPVKEEPKKEVSPQPITNENNNDALAKMNKLAEDVLFEFNKTQLEADGLSKLDKIAALMVQSPSLKINIVGHTCNIGSEMVNQLVSIRRATYVRIELINRGVNSKNINRSIGVGAESKLYDNQSEETQKKNRTIRFEKAN